MRNDKLKYINQYLKRNTVLISFCTVLIMIPFLICSFIFDAVAYDSILSLVVPLLLGGICFLCSSLYTVRFKRMIAQQERAYGVTFCDADAVHLETMLYLSKDWLILAGSLAFYKMHIKSVEHKRVHVNGRATSSTKVTVTTTDNQEYTIWGLSPSNIKKIKQWVNDSSVS